LERSSFPPQREKNQCPSAGVGFFVYRAGSSGFEKAKSGIIQRGEEAMAKPRFFVREDGGGRYRYAVVAAQGEDIHFYKDRFSKAELEVIAREMDAEIISIKTEEDVAIDEEEQAPDAEESEDVE
jgi:hypothetical protein